MNVENSYGEAIYCHEFDELLKFLQLPYGYDVWFTDKSIDVDQAARVKELLCTNSVLRSLTLTSDNISDECVQILCTALGSNSVLAYLDLSYNNISGVGGKAIAAALKTNESLTTLYLSDNYIGEDGAVALGQALETTKTLQFLYLNNNQVGIKGGASIATGLEKNQSLTYLDLNHNVIGAQGGKMLSNSLKVNTTLTMLYLYDNKLGAECGNDMLEMMKLNKSITYLGLRNNGIENAVIENTSALAKANASLRKQVYYESLQSNKKGPWHRSRLLVIGEGYAGKTATIRSVLSQQFDPAWKSTVGITLTETTVTSRGDWQSRDSKNYTSSLASQLAAAHLERKKTFVQENDAMLLQKHGLKDEVLFHFVKKSQTETGAKKRLERVYKFEEKLIINAKHKRNGLTLSIWDYGGQQVFHALHHLFLTEYGVYLLTFNMELLLRQGGLGNRVNFWLDSLALYAPTAPIILVGTFLDKVDEKRDITALNSIFNSIVKGKGSRQLNIVKGDKTVFFPVDNKGNRGVNELRRTIKETVMAQDYINFKVSVQWMRCLDAMVAEGESKGWISLEDAKKIAEREEVDTDSTTELQEMLSLFHELGVIIHFTATESLRSFVTTNPQWLIDSISKIIRDRKTHKFDTSVIESVGLTDDANMLYSQGVASRDLLEYLWGKNETQFLIDLTHRLLLLGPWNDDKDDTLYLIPSMVSNSRAEEVEPTGMKCMIEFEILPSGILERLICLCVHYSADIGVQSEEPVISKAISRICFGKEAVVYLRSKGTTIEVSIDSVAETSKYLKVIITMLRTLNQHVKNEGLRWKIKLEAEDALVDYDEAKSQHISPWFDSHQQAAEAAHYRLSRFVRA